MTNVRRVDYDWPCAARRMRGDQLLIQVAPQLAMRPSSNTIRNVVTGGTGSEQFFFSSAPRRAHNPANALPLP
jgi:hypothetical protein